MSEIYISFDGLMITVLDGFSASELRTLRVRYQLQDTISNIVYDRHQRAPIVHLHDSRDAKGIANFLLAHERLNRE